MKKRIFNIFAWRLELKLSKKKDNDRIVYLANKLLNELNTQGYETKTEHMSVNVEISCYYHRPSDVDIYSILNKWSISGKRGD